MSLDDRDYMRSDRPPPPEPLPSPILLGLILGMIAGAVLAMLWS